MRCALAVIGLLVLTTLSPAQSGDPAVARGPSVQVVGLDIDVALDIDRGLIEETVSITLSGRQTRTLQFAIDEGLSVESSKASSGLVLHRKAGRRLLVSLDPVLDGERTLTFRITGQPGGWGATSVGPRWAVLDPADNWYPSYPFTWAKSRVRVRAPEGWTAVAPGQPANGDSIWEWRTAKPVRAVAVAAAPGLTLSDGRIVATLVRVATPNETLDVETVRAVLGDPMAWFSGALAPYPFDGYNLVFIDGLDRRVRAGGMSVVPLETPLGGKPDGADLLAGQWYGELLAGDGRWIESFAAWQAVTYSRDRTSPMPEEIARLRVAYFDLGQGDAPLARADRSTPDEVVRGKGSAAPDAVLQIVGARAFFQAVGDLFAAPAGPPMSLDQVREVFEKRAGRTLERPFSDWFERTGAPELDATLRAHPSATGGWRADVALTQKGDPYALPVEVVIHGPGQSHRETVQISRESTAVFYILPFEPTRIDLDPLDRIYRRKKSPEAVR